jgi:hypothetical protein
VRKNRGAAQSKIFGVFDLGRVPLLDGATGLPVAVREPEPTTLEGWRNRDKQREQTRLAAEEKAKDDATRVAHDNLLCEYYSQVISAIVGRLGMRDDYCPLEPVESQLSAGTDFLSELTACGITLTDDAKNRLAAYCESQNAHTHGRIGVTVENLRHALNRLRSVGAFAEGELTEPTRESVTAPVDRGPTLGELFAKSNSDRDADRELRGVIAVMVDSEFVGRCAEWVYSVKNEFGYELTRFEIEQAWRFVRDHNLNPLRHDSWNAARVALVHQCVLHQSLLTCAEVLADQLRAGSITANEYHHRCNVLERRGLLQRPRNYATATT